MKSGISPHFLSDHDMGNPSVITSDNEHNRIKDLYIIHYLGGEPNCKKTGMDELMYLQGSHIDNKGTKNEACSNSSRNVCKI